MRYSRNQLPDWLTTVFAYAIVFGGALAIFLAVIGAIVFTIVGAGSAAWNLFAS